jgi:hypothetical protein
VKETDQVYFVSVVVFFLVEKNAENTIGLGMRLSSREFFNSARSWNDIWHLFSNEERGVNYIL